MKNKGSWLLVIPLAAAALLAIYMELGKAQFIPPGRLQYQTGCEAIDANTVEGFVTNNGPALLQINGPVSFNFTVAGSISHPTVQVQATALIPPARTVRVARERLAWSLLPSEVCQFDVSAAVR